MFVSEVKSAQDEDICILVKVTNHSYNYIVDCGEAKQLSVKDCQNANAIFISHTHIDHFVNFDTILRHQIGIQRRVVIVGPQGIIDQVQSRIKSYCWNLIEEGSISYEVREISEEGHYRSALLSPPSWQQLKVKEIKSEVVFTEKDFEVRCTLLDHKTTSVAYLFKAFDKTKIELTGNFSSGKWVGELISAYENDFEDVEIGIDDKKYLSKELFHMIHTEKGKTLGVIMDHAASESNHQKIADLFFECDQLYIECFYKDEDKELALANHHSFTTKSGEIVKRCNISNATPVHFSRKYDALDIIDLISQFDNARK